MSTIKSLTFKEIFMATSGLSIIFLFLWLLFFISNPLIVFLFFTGALLTFFILLNPFLGMLLLIIIRPTLDIFTDKSIFSIGSFSLNTASALAVLSIFFTLIMLSINFKKTSRIPLKIPISIFILITFISIFVSQNPATSAAEWLRLLSIFSIYFLGFTLTKSKDDFKKIIYAIIISTIIPGIIAFYQFFTQTGMTIIDENISNRIFGTFAHPNLLAYYLTIPIVFLIFLILNSKDKTNPSNKVYYLFLVPNLILLALTYTRGAWMVFLAVIFILGIFKFRKFLIITLLGLILAYFVFPPLNTRVNNLFEYDPYSSISWRINLWTDSLKYSQAEIISGYGLGTASEVILENRGERFGSSDPHNDYLKILLENGLLGLFSYLLIIIALLLRLLLSYKNSSDIFIKNFFLLFLGITLALYVISFADNVLRNTALQWIFWITLGGLFSIYQKSRSGQTFKK